MSHFYSFPAEKVETFSVLPVPRCEGASRINPHTGIQLELHQLNLNPTCIVFRTIIVANALARVVKDLCLFPVPCIDLCVIFCKSCCLCGS